MIRLEGGKPGDERGFVHKRILGGIKGFVAGGFNPLAGVKGFLTPPPRSRRPPPMLLPPVSTQPALSFKFPESAAAPLGLATGITRTAREFKQCMAAAGGNILLCLAEQARMLEAQGKNGGVGGGAAVCDPPLVRNPATGNCIFPGSPRGAAVFGGEAIMGQYGAGMVAGSQIVDRATCGRGMQLGNDGVCYNKSQISNKQRMWPAGRKPLLSGGDVRAISIAARAGRRMELATKRLQKMGMMKKPTRRGGVPAGHRAKLVHASEH